MEQRVTLITLGAEDPSRTRSFYVDGLGWKPVFESDGVVFFQAGALVVALYRLGELIGETGVEAGGCGSVALAYNVRTREAVDAVIAEARRAGATIAREPREMVWGGYSGYFQDPDGHLWEVSWNPHWPLDGSGVMRIPAAGAQQGSEPLTTPL